jgi:hypothetical protein
MCLVTLVAHGVVPAATRRLTRSTAVTGTQAAAAARRACLDCHGPAEKFMAGSVVYQVPGGTKVKPHRYVPHDSKLADEVPDCTNCHTAHSLSPLPKAGSIDRSKLNVDWCYKACHHTKDFKSCKDCHV